MWMKLLLCLQTNMLHKLRKPIAMIAGFEKKNNMPFQRFMDAMCRDVLSRHLNKLDGSFFITI